MLWRRLAPYGVSPRQLGVVMALKSGGRQSLGEVAGHIFSDDPTTCRVVDRLVERKLVHAAQDPRDRRRFCLTLTPKGRRLAVALEAIARELDTGIEEGLSRAERAALSAGLRRIIDNAGRMAEEAALFGEAAGRATVATEAPRRARVAAATEAPRRARAAAATEAPRRARVAAAALAPRRRGGRR